jgi:hypothetical protein
VAVAIVAAVIALRSVDGAAAGEIQRVVPATLVTPPGSPANAVRVARRAECVITRTAVIGRAELTSASGTPPLEMFFSFQPARGEGVVMATIPLGLAPGQVQETNVVVWGNPDADTTTLFPPGTGERCYLAIRAPGEELPVG